MNFRTWLMRWPYYDEGSKRLLERSNEVLGWDRDSTRWYNFGFGHRPEIQAYIEYGSRIVSIEYAGPQHPYMKRSLSALLRQRPEVKDFIIDFDGFRPGTIEQWLKGKGYHGPKDILPKYLFHGTSTYHWHFIKEDGLQPRRETGVGAAYGADVSSAHPANPDYIYLSSSFGNAVRTAARHASFKVSDVFHYFNPLVIKIDSKGLDVNSLRPDEDSRELDWRKSLHVLSSIAYEGSIEPQYITPVSILVDGKWREVKPGELDEEEDSLSKAFRDIGQLPKYGKFVDLKKY